MHVPEPDELLERVRALPAAEPLLRKLPAEPEVHLVGGAARDLLLGGSPTDLDLVVEGDAAALAAGLGGGLRIHDRFGTSTVRLGDFVYDIAMARRERYPRPGALPVVEPAGLQEDLRRRDFTVNAIAIALGGPRPGQVSAAPRALEDLEARRLRILHPASFEDDPTRLLRLTRYASRLGFEVESQTLGLMRRARDAGALATLSGSRIGGELRLLARENDAVRAFARLHDFGLDAAIHPRLGPPVEGLAALALALLPPDGSAELLVLGLSMRGMTAEDAAPLLDAWGFTAGERERVLGVLGAQALANALSRTGSRSGVARVLSRVSPEAVAVAGGLEGTSKARDWLAEGRYVRLAITGADLLAAQVPAGPTLGRALQITLEAKLDGRVSSRREELEHALRIARDAEAPTSARD